MAHDSPRPACSRDRTEETLLTLATWLPGLSADPGGLLRLIERAEAWFGDRASSLLLGCRGEVLSTPTEHSMACGERASCELKRFGSGDLGLEARSRAERAKVNVAVRTGMTKRKLKEMAL